MLVYTLIIVVMRVICFILYELATIFVSGGQTLRIKSVVCFRFLLVCVHLIAYNSVNLCLAFVRNLSQIYKDSFLQRLQ